MSDPKRVRLLPPRSHLRERRRACSASRLMISEPVVCCKEPGNEVVTSSHWRERSRATTGDLPPRTPGPVFNLLNAGYEYAYFDGLNRYYVAGEHENLKAAFKTPPNVFDDFLISKQIESERRAEARAQRAEERAAQVEAALRAVYSSRSLRTTL